MINRILTILISFFSITTIYALDTDTIKFLYQLIMIDDVKNNREYYQAILSLVEDEEAKKDTIGSEDLKEVKLLYKALIIGLEDIHFASKLSPQAEKNETELKQYLINNPKKVQFHINKGKKYSKRETGPLDFEVSPDFGKTLAGEIERDNLYPTVEPTNLDEDDIDDDQ